MSGQQAEQGVGEFAVGGAVHAKAMSASPAPRPDEEWELPNGFAHVFHGENHDGIRRPVLLADGFNLGPSDLEKLFQGLDGGGDYALLTEIRRSGRDVVLIGYDERSASIMDNAKTVTAAIQRTIAERQGSAPLTVGGFSMGGIIARYVLAKLEGQGIDHQTALYFSYDTPHRGAVIPIGLQAFSYFIPLANKFARQMDSPAAREMLWRHYDRETETVGVAPEREKFLAELRSVGFWPQIPRLIAVANGRGDGRGPTVDPGQVALASVGELVYPGTTFYTQSEGHEVVVAELKRLFPAAEKTITTSGFPELDGAPGGTLDSYGILAEMLERFGAEIELDHADICFVPTVSAVAIRDVDQPDDLYANVHGLPPEESDLDEFLCSSETTGHTRITGELGGWLLERLPD
ncbi:lipase family alpha/beta hydrolase [Streptomyces sp. NPDC060198]|uniref:lipase family alpha/beta hydrolase n=1 Tax=Streptomyces sp. NPDC060198 TaxID=3347070 RepID=UPI0036527ACB